MALPPHGFLCWCSWHPVFVTAGLEESRTCKSMPIKQSLFLPCPQSLAATNLSVALPALYFLPLDRAPCGLPCLASSTWRVKAGPCWALCQGFIPPHGGILFLGEDKIHFISSADEYLCCLHLWPTVNRAPVSVCIHAFVRAPVFSSLGCIPASGLLGHMVILCLTC